MFGTVTFYAGIHGLTVDGLYVDGHTGASIYNPHAGAICIKKVLGDIEIKNCTFINLIKTTFAASLSAWGDNDNPAIFLYYGTTVKTDGTVNIHDNTIQSVFSDAIAVEGVRAANYTNVYNNTVEGFGENCVDLKGSRYVNIYNNDFSWNDFGSTLGEKSWGATMIGGNTSSLIDGGSAIGYFNIHDNYFHDSSLAVIRINNVYASKVYNNYFKDIGGGVEFAYGSSSNMEVYNNLFNMTLDAGSTTQMSNSAYRVAVSLRYASNIKVFNNSIYINTTTHNYGIYVSSDIGSGNEIKNNIVQMVRNNSSVYPLYSKDTGVSVSYNNFYGVNSNRVFWAGTVYGSAEQAAWRSAGHTGGLFSNPKFSNAQTGDFSLQTGSPCILPNMTLGVLTMPSSSAVQTTTQEMAPPQGLSIIIDTN